MQYAPGMALSWDDLRVVLAVRRRGSHGGAARLLGVDPTTVGRRIAVVEEALRARLFDRTPAGLEPTAAGLALAARAESVEEQVLAAERELGGADARLEGPVRITAGDGIAHYLILPALADLRREHPGITIEIRADTRSLDLSRREADVAVRLARPSEPTLVARRLGPIQMALYASRAYLDRRGSPRTKAALAEHDFIGFDASLDDLPQTRWLRSFVRSPRWVVRATTTTAQLVACAEGQGIAVLGTFLAPREPRLVPVLPSQRPPPRDAWIVTHEDMRSNARVAAVAAWLSRLGLATF
jgi:DNA-binding transcriptional LysR family regulator